MSKEAFVYDITGLLKGLGAFRQPTGLVYLLQEIQPDGRYTYIYTDPDSYEPLAQVRNWTNNEGESKQEIHYFHCDQIGIPREMTDDEKIGVKINSKYPSRGKIIDQYVLLYFIDQNRNTVFLSHLFHTKSDYVTLLQKENKKAKYLRQLS